MPVMVIIICEGFSREETKTFLQRIPTRIPTKFNNKF